MDVDTVERQEIRALRLALAEMLDTALACDDTAWTEAIARAKTCRPCDAAADALDRSGAWRRKLTGNSAAPSPTWRAHIAAKD